MFDASVAMSNSGPSHLEGAGGRGCWARAGTHTEALSKPESVIELNLANPGMGHGCKPK